MGDATNTTSRFTTTVMQNLEKVSTNISKMIYNVSTESYTEFSDNNETTQTSIDVLNVVTTQVTNMSGTTKTSTCTTTKTTTTEDPFDEFGPPEGVEYIFVPLGVMIFVIILSAVVLIVSRRRKMERLRHRLMPLYNFDPGEEGEDDWETELLDEGLGNRQRRQGYQSMDHEENSELFGH
ncbi:hypothetical protein PV325_005254 [Microctonus aethiopoides]|uniref:Uncharacterized protein n=1 Tax=Microctonus aethiopoides TaxID=144406 RepID=A0AA39KTF3_9HYME|nr:hypothetical protein PV325_005254 [Microctonus aethiopoides]KAK0084274.1 hypothetical protein PV326_006327 [Microctonus aethiopoides]KAK0173258.1 hypothetical protein PV328_006483 [Microctonus aethiopoides]